MLEIKTFSPKVFPDLIERIWMVEGDDKPVDLILPPNQYVNLIFPINKSTYTYENRIVDKPQIEGISLRSTSLTYPSNIKLVGIRFYAYGIYPFIRIKGKDILNNSLNCPLSYLDMKEIVQTSINDPEQVILDRINESLNNLFDKKAYEFIKPLMKFYKYYRLIDETSTLEDYYKECGTNYTTFNRKFSEIIGISPKIFERLIKFRKSLCSVIDSHENLTTVGTNSGYFDQAHFIREFKLFLNHTPSTFQNLIKLADKNSKVVNYNFRLFKSV